MNALLEKEIRLAAYKVWEQIPRKSSLDCWLYVENSIKNINYYKVPHIEIWINLFFEKETFLLFVNKMIEKFERIPESLWIMGQYINDQEQKCALGHCIKDNKEFNLLKLTFEFFMNMNVTTVNDLDLEYKDKRYYNLFKDCSGPKERILLALNCIKKELEEAHKR